MRTGAELTRMLREAADEHRPRDARSRIVGRARRQRRNRMVVRLAAPVVIVVAAGVSTAVVATGSESKPTRVSTVSPAGRAPTTTPRGHGRSLSTPTTAPAATTTTVSIAAATIALDAYVATKQAGDHPPAGLSGSPPSLHSPPVDDAGLLVAVAAFDYRSDGHPVQVLAYRDNRWTLVVGLPSPDWPPKAQPGTLYLASAPVQTADVTGDGRPDFLIHLNAADNEPGFVVSEDAGGWQYVPFSGPYPRSNVVGRNPAFVNTRMVSEYNDCNPSCAAGHTYQVAWTYRRDRADFWSPDPPGWTPSPGAENYSKSSATRTSAAVTTQPG